MNLSPFFRNLRSAYQAELDDLTQDSEGKNVLRKRLADKRKEIGFLAQMIELSPEMVAVVFHQGFRFTTPAALDKLVGLQPKALPDWATLSSAVTLEPWAHSLAEVVLRQPGGDRFMAVAAGLEYLQHHPRMAQAQQAEAPEHTESDGDDDAIPLSADDDTGPHDDHTREEAGADWLADQGFDRKD